MPENNIQTLANDLQGALMANPNCLQGQSLGCFNPWQTISPAYCQHNIGADEELLLNAIRRKPEMKAILLKTALTELLKGL